MHVDVTGPPQGQHAHCMQYIPVLLANIETSYYHLEGHLGHKGKFISLKKASAGVHEDRVGDAVYQVIYSLLDIIGWYSSFNGMVKHNIECL